MSKDKKTYRTLSEKEIRDYLQGRLSEEEAHRLERHALDSPFEREALEGLEKFDQDTVSRDISFLKEKIHKRAKRRTYYGWKVAAMAALLIVSVAVLWMTVTKTTDTVAMNEAEYKEEALGPEAKEEIPAPDIPHVRPERPVPPVALRRLRRGHAANLAQKKVIEHVTPQEEPATEAFTEEEADVWYPDKKTAEEVVVEEPVMTPADGLAMNDPLRDIRERQERIGEQINRASEVAAGSKRSFAQSRAVVAAVVSAPVSGKVTDESGEPLPGVSVTVKGTPAGTMTDIEGRYSIQLPAGLPMRSTTPPTEGPTLRFAFIGMQTEEVAVGGREEVNVVLQADVMALSEVVVTGYGVEGANEVGYEGARPEGGIAAYREYLKEAKRYPPEAEQNHIEGKVVLKVTVSVSGEIEDIEVKRSLGYGCDEEAIRLVREGPGWLPAKKDGENVPGTVRVKIEF